MNDQNGEVSSLDIGKPLPSGNGNPVDVVTTKSVSPFQSSISSVLGELSPIEQITTLIGQQGANAATQGYLSGSNEVLPAGSVLSSGVKTLSLALEPQDLGSVTIKLRLSKNGLELNVEADRLGTARLIEKDKDKLLKGLESSGYLVDTLVVKATDNQSPTLQQGSYSDSRNLDSNSKNQEHQATGPNFQQDNSNANDGRGSENKNGQPKSFRLGTGSGDLPPSVGNGDIYI